MKKKTKKWKFPQKMKKTFHQKNKKELMKNEKKKKKGIYQIVSAKYIVFIIKKTNIYLEK